MESLKKSEIKLAAKVFAQAMFNDDIHKYLLPDEKTRLKKLEHLYVFKLKSEINNAYKTSSDLEGVCIWESPDNHHSAITFYDIISGFPLIFTIGLANLRRMIKYQVWSTKIRESLMKRKYWYLNVIAVCPDHQGKGFATKLIKQIIERATENNEDVYLETQNKNNIAIYERYGFKLIETYPFENTGISHFCMIKYK
jgi:ribosomal protein S18 acetylase RimI-like enzyme